MHYPPFFLSEGLLFLIGSSLSCLAMWAFAACPSTLSPCPSGSPCQYLPLSPCPRCRGPRLSSPLPLPPPSPGRGPGLSKFPSPPAPAEVQDYIRVSPCPRRGPGPSSPPLLPQPRSMTRQVSEAASSSDWPRPECPGEGPAEQGPNCYVLGPWTQFEVYGSLSNLGRVGPMHE